MLGCTGSLLLQVQFSLVAGSGDYSLVAMHGLFIVVAPCVVEDGALGLQASGAAVHGLSCPATCGIWTRDPLHS